MTTLLLTLSLFVGAVNSHADDSFTGPERAFLKRQARAQEKEKKYADRFERIAKAKKQAECRQTYSTQIETLEMQLNKMLTSASQYLEGSEDYAKMKTAGAIVGKLMNAGTPSTDPRYEFASRGSEAARKKIVPELKKIDFEFEDIIYSLEDIFVGKNSTQLTLKAESSERYTFSTIILPHNGQNPYFRRFGEWDYPDRVLSFVKEDCLKPLFDQIQLRLASNPQAEATNVEAQSNTPSSTKAESAGAAIDIEKSAAQ